MPLVHNRTPLVLGVLDLVPRFAGCSDEIALQEAVQLAQEAERWGYARYWAAEHHSMEGLACASPEVLLSHIGALTTRISLGSGALLLPHYSPLKVAEWFRMLSVLYPGRIELGMGRAPGGDAHTAMALSGNFLERVANYRDSAAALIALLQDSYKYEDQSVTARPVPLIPPSLWMLGTNVKSAGFAAELGTGYVFGRFMSEGEGTDIVDSYRKQFRPSLLQDKPRTIVAVHATCAPTLEEASTLSNLTASAYADRGGLPFQGSVVGTPGMIRKELQELQARYRNDEFLIVCSIPDYEMRRRSYRLLSELLH